MDCYLVSKQSVSGSYGDGWQEMICIQPSPPSAADDVDADKMVHAAEDDDEAGASYFNNESTNR